MATAAEMRAWLRDNGYAPGAKGALAPALVEAYESAHGGGGADYPDPDFESAFAVASPPDEPVDLAVPEEVRPRRPKRPRPGVSFPNPFGKSGVKRASGGTRKPKRARVGLEDLISGVWGIASRFTRPVAPMSRILAIQAPVAGVLLEPAVKGTVVDRLLQPLARAEQQGKVWAGLAGPPVLVGMISWHLQQCAMATPPADPNPVFMAAATEMLRESLLIYADVAGPKFAEAAERVKRRETQLGGPVDELMAYLFSPLPDPADADAVAAEDEAIRRAQGLMDETATMGQ